LQIRLDELDDWRLFTKKVEKSGMEFREQVAKKLNSIAATSIQNAEFKNFVTSIPRRRFSLTKPFNWFWFTAEDGATIPIPQVPEHAAYGVRKRKVRKHPGDDKRTQTEPIAFKLDEFIFCLEAFPVDDADDDDAGAKKQVEIDERQQLDLYTRFMQMKNKGTSNVASETLSDKRKKLMEGLEDEHKEALKRAQQGKFCKTSLIKGSQAKSIIQQDQDRKWSSRIYDPTATFLVILLVVDIFLCLHTYIFSLDKNWSRTVEVSTFGLSLVFVVAMLVRAPSQTTLIMERIHDAEEEWQLVLDDVRKKMSLESDEQQQAFKVLTRIYDEADQKKLDNEYLELMELYTQLTRMFESNESDWELVANYQRLLDEGNLALDVGKEDTIKATRNFEYFMQFLYNDVADYREEPRFIK